LGLPGLFESEGHLFLIRWSMKTGFERDTQRNPKEGVNKQGRKYLEEWGWMGSKKDPRRRYVRRITVVRPGEVDVIIFTNLLDETVYLAADLMELYLQRWSIENVFQQVTEVFHLKRLISSSPCGTIFQFAFCSMMYNQLILQRSYIVNSTTNPETTEASPPIKTKETEATVVKPVASKKPTKTAIKKPAVRCVTNEMFSMDKYFKDAVEELIAWKKMIPMEWTINYFAPPMSANEMRSRLNDLLSGRWNSKWLKATKKKYTPKKEDPPQPGGHTSIYRLIHGDPRTKVV